VADFTNGDLATGLWKTGLDELPEIFVCSAYMDITYQSVWPPLLERLLRYCTRRGKEVIIYADTNAHSSLWHCEDTNARGEKLEELINSFNLAVCNIGNHCTFFNRRAATIIDVTIATPAVAGLIRNWRVDTRVTGSDHHFISSNITISTQYRYTRNFIKGDWNLFRSSMEHKACSPVEWTLHTLEVEAKSFLEDIAESLNESHPLRKVSNRIQPFTWWNDECANLKKEVKRLSGRFRYRRTEASHEALTEARRNYSKAIRKAKREDWKRFCNEANDQKKVSLLNRVINAKENQTLGLLHSGDGTLNDSPEQSLELLLDTHFPGSIKETEENANAHPLTEGDDSFITTQRVQAAAASFGDLKASGPDGIPPVALKRLGKKANQRLTELLKASYRLGYVPSVWRHSRVIFIPKQGKDSYTLPRSFRPITLSSFIMKTLERVVLWHLEDTSLIEIPLSKDQHAFRKGRSTETALSNMTEYIESALLNKSFALGVFLDIQGAFDNVPPQSILRGLGEKNADTALLRWYGHYLCNRSIEVEYKGIKAMRHLTRGTPQGGVLSPVMWNLVFEGLLAKYQEGPVKCCGYADDAGLIITGSKPSLLVGHMQTAVNNALKWGQENELTFSGPKTVAVLFTRNRKFSKPREIKVGDNSVPYSDSVKYLGVTLDAKLTWALHINKKIRAAKAHMLSIKNAMGKLWGAPPRNVCWAYTGIVRPALTYGSIVWAKGCQGVMIMRKLTRINRLALLTLGHFRYSTPTAGLEVIMNVLPLDLHIKQVAALAMWRIRSCNQIKLQRLTSRFITHRQYNLNNLRMAAGDVIDGDLIQTKRKWVREFSMDKDGWNGKPLANEYELYTDGSRFQGKTGGGVCAYLDGDLIFQKSFHLGDDATVFQAEVMAIKHAAEWLKTHERRFKRVTIHCDSQSAIRALLSPWIHTQTVEKAVTALDSASKGNFVKLRWVKAHVGYVGNELADELAKAGALDPTTQFDTIPPSTSSIKRLAAEGFERIWDNQWKARTDCRQTKQWFPSINKTLSRQIIKLDRENLSAMVQLITGHNFLKRHSSLVNKTTDKECRFCLEDEETTFHVMAECPAFARIRLNELGAITLSEPLSWDVRSVLSFLRETSVGCHLRSEGEDQ
jgi:ribonuclease HI